VSKVSLSSKRSHIRAVHEQIIVKSFNIKEYSESLESVSLKQINTFIQQGCIKWIKIDSKDIYNATKNVYFK